MTSGAARRAGRAVFRYLESFCERLIPVISAVPRGADLRLRVGLPALTLLRACVLAAGDSHFKCVIFASIVALLIHAASNSSQFHQGHRQSARQFNDGGRSGRSARFKG